MRNLTIPLILLTAGAVLVGCSTPEPAPDTSKVVHESQAPPMDGGANADGGAAPAGGAAPQKSDEGS